MSAMTATAAKLTIPPEVHAFVRERGLEPYFPQIVAILERVFAEANAMSVEVHEDPEVSGLRCLLFEVEVPWDVDKTCAVQEQWYQETAKRIPTTLINEFSLVLYQKA